MYSIRLRRSYSFVVGYISMVEIMFVIAVIAVIMIAATRQLQTNVMKTNATAIGAATRILLKELSEYYYHNCANGTLSFTKPNVITLATLENAQLLDLSNTPIEDPLGNDLSNYQMSIFWEPVGKIWMTQVTYTFPGWMNTSANQAKREIYRTLLKPNVDQDKSTMIWRQPAGTALQEKTSMMSPLLINAENYSQQWYIDTNEHKYVGYYTNNYYPPSSVAPGTEPQSCVVYNQRHAPSP